jgi:hypothetical protein
VTRKSVRRFLLTQRAFRCWHHPAAAARRMLCTRASLTQHTHYNNTAAFALRCALLLQRRERAFLFTLLHRSFIVHAPLSLKSRR